MPALAPTTFSARVIWLGVVTDRTQSLRASACDELVLGFDGPRGDSHAGLTRPSCSRVLAQHPRNTTIRNTRQLSILSQEELDATALAIGAARIDPAAIGASMIVAGIPDFTLLPPASRLQGPDGATLVIDMENLPCTLAAREIARDTPAGARAYKPAAQGRRGVTAWVEREGVIRLGDRLSLHIPAQPPWPHHATALRR